MVEGKDCLVEKLRLLERAREDVYFCKVNQELIEKMRQEKVEEVEEAARLHTVFTPILVPVDFSPYSTKALRQAADIAGRFNASLIVLHVIAREAGARATQQRLEEKGLRLPGLAAGSETTEVSEDVLESIIVEHREQSYIDLLAFLPSWLAKHPLELRVVVGHPVERILETAVHENVGLIILGTHGRTGLSRMILGSVAERIARLAPCPVMLVKEPSEEEKGWLQEFSETFVPPKSS